MYLLIEFPGQKKRLFVHDKKTLKKSALSHHENRTRAFARFLKIE